MEQAALILSTISLLVSLPTLVFVLVKHFSTKEIQFVPVEEAVGKKKVETFLEQFREIGDKVGPIGDDI